MFFRDNLASACENLEKLQMQARLEVSYLISTMWKFASDTISTCLPLSEVSNIGPYRCL